MTEIVQGTPEWFAARCGKATASKFKDILAKTKSGPAASRRNYIGQLVRERLTGNVERMKPTPAMLWGTEKEPEARMTLEERGILVTEVGFLQHSELMVGASPDGLIGDDGMLEIKCPETANHIDTLLYGMPKMHMAQIQGQLWIADRKWCTFVSYDPRMPERMQLYTETVMRDAEYIDNLQKEVVSALTEVESIIKQLEGMSWLVSTK